MVGAAYNSPQAAASPCLPTASVNLDTLKVVQYVKCAALRLSLWLLDMNQNISSNASPKRTNSKSEQFRVSCAFLEETLRVPCIFIYIYCFLDRFYIALSPEHNQDRIVV